MKILACGSRAWDDRPAIEQWLATAYRTCRIGDGKVFLVNGYADGADKMAREYGLSQCWEIRDFLVTQEDWNREGRKAGVLRNARMLKEEHRPEEPIDICVAFTVVGERSPGTKDMIDRCRLAGIVTIVVPKRF